MEHKEYIMNDDIDIEKDINDIEYHEEILKKINEKIKEKKNESQQ